MGSETHVGVVTHSFQELAGQPAKPKEQASSSVRDLVSREYGGEQCRKAFHVFSGLHM